MQCLENTNLSLKMLVVMREVNANTLVEWMCMAVAVHMIASTAMQNRYLILGAFGTR